MNTKRYVVKEVGKEVYLADDEKTDDEYTADLKLAKRFGSRKFATGCSCPDSQEVVEVND